ncbi:MAG: hypothetical protein ACI9MR_001911 [Myxococcota bacterium]|jgi:hypothetical protein
MKHLWWFNPQCEAENAARVAGYYTARDSTRALAADLDVLPTFVAAGGDAVWVQSRPTTRYADALSERGFAEPEFVERPLTHPDRRQWRASPWGWSPDAALLAAKLAAGEADVHSVASWPDSRRACFAKTTWTGVLESLRHELPADIAPPAVDVGVTCASANDVTEAVAALFAQDVAVAVVKAPFGTAGQGAKRVVKNQWGPGMLNWVQRIIDQQEEALVEPWRARLLDLSVLATVDTTGETEVLGLTRFLTDRRGQYQGTWLHGPATAPLERFRKPMEHTARRVGAALARRGHRGAFGVDAMVYAAPDAVGRPNTLTLKPLLEVNPRFTMGHIALSLAARMPAVPAMWRLYGPKELKASGGPTALAGQLGSQNGWPTNDPTRVQRTLGMVVEDPVGRGLVEPVAGIDTNHLQGADD